MRRLFPPLPRTVWVLGCVSLLMDMSSEVVHSLLPALLVGQLGASALTLGWIEGLAEATALVLRVFSGALSDAWGRRKALLLAGYGLAALSKPLFPLAAAADAVLAARLMDRVGKGIRAAPRDALVADVAPRELLGACYGLRQSLDTLGALLGPLLAVVLLWWLADLRTVLWLALIPALLSVLLVATGVRERRRPRGAWVSPLDGGAWRRFPAAYWWVVALGALVSLARFSEAFLVLRAQAQGLALMWLPLVMVVMSGVYTLSAYPAGVLADRVSRPAMLVASLLLLAGADALLARDGLAWAFAGIALWGLHMGLSQGLLAAMVAEHAPAELRGSAFGVFNLACAGGLLVASVLAGALWDAYGPTTAFRVGMALALSAAVMCWLCRRRAAPSASRARP